ncbi:MAG: hypothetical protein E7667_06365 [Ruminococcaceae bacterium]|nr:hypothetical protein [Oscillospiraceae bacterium]
MSFNRENYKRIKEEYDGKYLKARDAADLRRAQIHAEIPEIAKLDRELSGVGLEVLEAAISGRADEIERIKAKNTELLSRRGELLAAAGYPADYTEIKYECELCSDTGAIDNKMCSCMRRKLVEAGIASSGMSDLIKRQSFENFSLDYYKQSEQVYSVMSAIYKVLCKYAEDFAPQTSGNIAMFGGTGLGKTHLSSAVAGKVIQKGHDVYYASALSLFADFELRRFGNSASVSADGNINRYFDCDLLIIDDLGTEVTNQFTTSCLYDIINSRLNAKKPTIISTNLSQDEFRKRYWDRITSRVLGEYSVLPFCGTDIRSQKLRR